MRFYHVEIEGTGLGLGLGDEFQGFIANRYVMASNQSDAETRALAISRKTWTKLRASTGSKCPRFEVVQVEPISFLHGLKSLRQNQTHIFY